MISTKFYIVMQGSGEACCPSTCRVNCGSIFNLHCLASCNLKTLGDASWRSYPTTMGVVHTLAIPTRAEYTLFSFKPIAIIIAQSWGQTDQHSRYCQVRYWYPIVHECILWSRLPSSLTWAGSMRNNILHAQAAPLQI